MYGNSSWKFSSLLLGLSKETLAAYLAEIYETILCDDTGAYSPEESIAAESASDAIEQIDLCFQRLSLEVENAERNNRE